MKRNVGLLTFHYSMNYGAVAQAYAMQQLIKNLGHEVTIIDYRPEAARKYVNQTGLRSLRPISTYRKKRNFKRFFSNYYNLTPETYNTPADLYRNPPQFDAVVIGSDQPWNIKAHRGFDKPFFLDFVQDPSKRISYAPSFGLTSDLGQHSDEIGGLLKRFDHLSVREQAGVELIQNLIGQTPAYVLDPSFLIDYDEVTKQPELCRDYLLVYADGLTPSHENSIHKIAAQQKLQVVSVIGKFSKCDREYRHARPEEWLGLFKHASYICTNFFHGTAFAIKHHKNFSVFPRQGNESRMLDLCRRFDLENRFVSGDKSDESFGIEQLAIDYSSIEPTINRLCEESVSYLENALR